jgi:hypothetical protein
MAAPAGGASPGFAFSAVRSCDALRFSLAYHSVCSIEKSVQIGLSIRTGSFGGRNRSARYSQTGYPRLVELLPL